MFHQNLDALLEDAFLEGNSTFITNLSYEASNNSLLEIVANKIAVTLNLCLVSLDQNEPIVKNVLKILTDFIPILKNDLEQSLLIAECMLRIATEEIVPVNILKCAVFNLNLLLDEDGPVLNWLQNEESLEGFILILGRRLSSVGDFECQSCIFETLCHIVYDNQNKHEWIHSWFTDDEKTRSMFLNWNLEQFTVESRKILNQINRRELNPRTYAFAATAVYFGNVQLKKLNGLEFWIDFNYDSKSISFFCKDFEFEDQDTSESWETVAISSNNVESYSVQKKKDIKSIELCITLNCSCRDLVVSTNPSFETNLVCMNFWIYVDISSHLKVIFGEPEILATNHAANSQESQESQRTQKVSLSVDVLEVGDHDDTAATRKVRKISTSDVVKIHAEDYSDVKKRRISDSTELVCLSDAVNNFEIANSVHKSHDSSQKRKASCSSLFLKESDSERSFQMNDKNKHAKFQFITSNSNEKYFRNNEKFTNEEDKDTNGHCNVEHNSQIFRSERKSSDASCGIDYKSDDSYILIIDTCDGEERSFKEMSENFLKEKHEIVRDKHSDGLQTVSEPFIENKAEVDNILKSHTSGLDIRIEESISNCLNEKPSQPNKTEANLSFKDSQIIRNSNESVKLSQKDKKPVSSEGSHSSQKRTKNEDGSTKVFQAFSDEEYVISPMPSNREKSRKTTMLTSNNLKDHTFSESQSYFENHADTNERERNISHKTVFDEDIKEDFKNLNFSQSKNTQDDTLNRQKKMRLYNINRDPVYDVPPSEQKKVNVTPTQKNSAAFVDLSFKNQNKNLLLNSLPLSDEDFCKTKFFRKKSTDSLETKKKHNIKNGTILETSDKSGENKLLENKFLAKGQIKDQEVKSSKQDSIENELHLSDKNAADSEPRKKRLKKNSDEVGKRKSSNNRPWKRKPNHVDKEIISGEASPKKQRKAAIKAMAKNKTILEEKEVDLTETFNEKSSNINHSNEIEEVFSTPPTKPVKKRKLKSVFLTDTETGSSNVSWIGGKNSRLFETPEKLYSKRRKSKQALKSTSSKKGTYKPTVVNSKRKQNSNFSMADFEIKSKSGLSDFENYELVVETKTGHKKSSHVSHKPFTFKNVSKAINAAIESCVDKHNFYDQLDNEPNNANFESRILKNNAEFYYHDELHGGESMVKYDFITAESNLTNVDREDFKSNVTDESNIVQMKAKHSSLKEKLSRNSKSLFQEKGSSSNSELHQKTVFNDRPLSSSVKKRKPANPASKEKAKRNRRDVNNTQYVNLGIVTHTDDGDFHAQDLITQHKISPNIPSAFTTQNTESPIILEKSQNGFLSMREKAHESHLHPTSPSPKIGILTEQSLSSLASNEAAGKEYHIKRYLSELSGESNSPNNFQPAENVHQACTSLDDKTSKSNKSSRSDNLLKNLEIFEEPGNCLCEATKMSELSSAKSYIDVEKKEQFTNFEEFNGKSKASSDRNLRKFSLWDDHGGSDLQEFPERSMKEDSNQESSKIKGRKHSKLLYILHVLGVEMDKVTHKLLKTLQKHFHDFNIKIAASREKILVAANDWGNKDLKNIAKAYKVNRIHAEESLKKILLLGQEYFEAEEILDRKIKRLHKKALEIYGDRIQLAETYAVEALEERIAAKTEMLLKSVLKKIEHF